MVVNGVLPDPGFSLEDAVDHTASTPLSVGGTPVEPEQNPELDRPIVYWSVTTTRNHFRYIALSGEIDMATEERACELVDLASDGLDDGELIVGLTGVDFMDSTGFHLLSRCAASLSRLGARLSVKVPPLGTVPRVLDTLDFPGDAICRVASVKTRR